VLSRVHGRCLGGLPAPWKKDLPHRVMLINSGGVFVLVVPLSGGGNLKNRPRTPPRPRLEVGSLLST